MLINSPGIDWPSYENRAEQDNFTDAKFAFALYATSGLILASAPSLNRYKAVRLIKTGILSLLTIHLFFKIFTVKDPILVTTSSLLGYSIGAYCKKKLI